MTDQEIKDAIRGFIKSWAAGDVKNALSFFAEDGVWKGPQGTFKGTSQIVTCPQQRYHLLSHG
jgi:ketosteroid isomerase-like protein